MKKALEIMIFFMALCQAGMAQKKLVVDLLENSYLSIDGSTNLISFKLTQNEKNLTLKNYRITAIRNQNTIYFNKPNFPIYVDRFTSKNPMALRDFLKLIKSETYPVIEVEIDSLQILSSSKDNFTTNAYINFTITGVKKQYQFQISTSSDNNFFILKGSKKINIHDFNLSPPDQIFGLIKVSEFIVINLHFILKTTTT
jgi:hypothetical protein